MAFGAPFPGAGVILKFNGAFGISIPSSTPFTFSNVPLGPVSPSRIVVIAFPYYAVGFIGSLSIDGVAATQLVAASTTGAGPGVTRAEIWAAALPNADTVGSVAMGNSINTFPRLSIGSYSLYGASSLMPQSTVSSNANGGTLTNASVGIACSTNYHQGIAAWTGLTEDFQVNDGGAANVRIYESTASGLLLPGGAVSVAPNSSMVAAAW